jgi:hypothetical protein
LDFDKIERYNPELIEYRHGDAIIMVPHVRGSYVEVGHLELAVARVKELEEKGGRLAAVLGNILIHIDELGLRKGDGIYGDFHYRNLRAESAEQKLANVLKLAEEGLPELSWGAAKEAADLYFEDALHERENQFLSRMAAIREAVK